MKQDLNDMAYFSAVVQHGGFTAAGRALNVSKSLLSRRVAELESRIGIRLLNRSSRQFSVTDIGAQYAEQCRHMLEQAERAQQLIDDTLARPKGKLSISAPITMTETFLAPLVANFLHLYEDVQIDIMAVNRDVDIIEEGIDIDIRAKPLPLEDSNLHFRALNKQRDLLVASPRFIERHRDLFDSIQNLSQLPTLTRKDNPRGHFWTLEHAVQGRKKFPIRPRLSSNNLIVLIQATIAGTGLCMLPEALCQEALKENSLQQVFHEWRSPETLLHLVFASHKGGSSAFRAFVDYLSDCFSRPNEMLEELKMQAAKHFPRVDNESNTSAHT